MMKVTGSKGFSLVEVVLALGILSFALLPILALLPLGLQTAGEAVDDTRTSLIAQDTVARLQTMRAADPLKPFSTTWWYDKDGRWIPMDAGSPDYSTVHYRVDLKRGPLDAYPPNTDPASGHGTSIYSTRFVGVSIQIGWPANPATGELPSGQGEQIAYSLHLRATPDL